jgi:SAM-dependent methyltransferase
MLSHTIDQLDAIRVAELRLLMRRYESLFSGADILEIGTGTGAQLRELSKVAASSVGVDLRSSDYHPSCNNFTYYDGVNLPFADQSFDVIYSSNTMEHVVDEPALHAELKRVMKPGAVAIHIVPSCAWRLWTTAVSYLMLPTVVLAFLRRSSEPSSSHGDSLPASPPRNMKARVFDLICLARHGERGNRFTEWWHFRARSWRRRFGALGWTVERVEGVGLFYTGYLFADSLMSMKRRERLSSILGSACHIVVLRPKMDTHTRD